MTTSSTAKLTVTQRAELVLIAAGSRPMLEGAAGLVQRRLVDAGLARSGVGGIGDEQGMVYITLEGHDVLVATRPVKEIATSIATHLKRIEHNKTLNPPRSAYAGTSAYYNAGAYAMNGKVAVTYISYQGHSNLTRDDAVRYLAWLDAGNVGHHYKALRADVT